MRIPYPLPGYRTTAPGTRTRLVLYGYPGTGYCTVYGTKLKLFPREKNNRLVSLVYLE